MRDVRNQTKPTGLLERMGAVFGGPIRPTYVCNLLSELDPSIMKLKETVMFPYLQCLEWKERDVIVSDNTTTQEFPLPWNPMTDWVPPIFEAIFSKVREGERMYYPVFTMAPEYEFTARSAYPVIVGQGLELTYCSNERFISGSKRKDIIIPEFALARV
jgi:hypothetical protein